MNNMTHKSRYSPYLTSTGGTHSLIFPDDEDNVIMYKKPDMNKIIRSGRLDTRRQAVAKLIGSLGSNASCYSESKLFTLDDSGLTEEQALAMEALESGADVFLTGEAGTGKSHVLKKYLQRNKDKNIIVCAFTGIAAINVGGSTIHRVFKAPVGLIEHGEYKHNPPDEVVRADIIVIDEISMLRIDLFEFVIRTIRQAERKRQELENYEARLEGREPKAIGRKQLIVVGDFFQLPPVIGPREESVFYNTWKNSCGGFAFASELWNEIGFKTIALKQVIRQSGDLEYIRNLNKIRVGDESGISWFNDHISTAPQKDAIYLCGTNKTAADFNERESNALPGEPMVYYARSSGVVNDGDKMTADVLALKVGMQVMTLVNAPGGEYQNGSIGRIVSLYDDHVVLKLNDGRVVAVTRFEWEIIGYEVHDGALEQVVIGRFNQIPIKIAYAITIHKSQGQTYDKVNVIPQCFAPGQLYVALSRARSSAGMSLMYPIAPGALMTNPHVKRFYEES